MTIRNVYLAIGGLIVVAVAVVLIFGNGEKSAPQQAPESTLPPGHPKVGQSQQGAPGAPNADNVRQDFIAELDRLKTKVAKQSPKDTSDVLMLGRMLSDSHQTADAIPLLERYSKAAPRNVEVMFDLAVVYYNAQMFDKSLAATMKILSLEPKNSKAMYNLGAIYASMGKKEQAQKAWNDVITQAPKSEDAARAREAMKQL